MGWVRTTICPAYDGSVRISPQPVAAVVKMRSPSAVSPDPRSVPRCTRPPSSATRPGTERGTVRVAAAGASECCSRFGMVCTCAPSRHHRAGLKGPSWSLDDPSPRRPDSAAAHLATAAHELHDHAPECMNTQVNDPRPPALWGGRFQSPAADAALDLSSSLEIDLPLAAHDVAASRAHVEELLALGLVDTGQAAQLDDALASIGERLANGTFEWRP